MTARSAPASIEGMILAGLVAGARHGHHLHPPRVHRPGAHPRARRSSAAIATGILGDEHPRHRTWRSISRCSSAPAATSAARRARCSRRSKASAPSRATSRRSRASQRRCGTSRPSSTTSRRLLRAGDPRARARVAEGPGHERLGRRQVRRRQRRRASSPASTRCRWARRIAS